MTSLFNPLFILICTFGMMLTSSAFAQNKQSNTPTEQWQHHTTGNYTPTPGNRPAYYKTPPLKPAKKNMQNPLRQQGWHTHPDPYIEKGGVYTNKTHPAMTQQGQTLRNFSSGSPNSFVTPPSTVLSPYRNGSKQQAVQIQNPVPGNLAPIDLPAEKN